MRLSRFRAFFYERVPDCCMPRRYHARAYYDPMRGKLLMVLWPFNYAVQFVAWLDLKWCEAMHRESWIDREVTRRAGKRVQERYEACMAQLMRRTK